MSFWYQTRHTCNAFSPHCLNFAYFSDITDQQTCQCCFPFPALLSYFARQFPLYQVQSLMTVLPLTKGPCSTRPSSSPASSDLHFLLSFSFKMEVLVDCLLQFYLLVYFFTSLVKGEKLLVLQPTDPNLFHFFLPGHFLRFIFCLN